MHTGIYLCSRQPGCWCWSSYFRKHRSAGIFPKHASLEFSDNGRLKRKYVVSSSSPGEKAQWMLQVREWPDTFELIGRQRHQNTSQPRYAKQHLWMHNTFNLDDHTGFRSCQLRTNRNFSQTGKFTHLDSRWGGEVASISVVTLKW